MPKNTKKHLKNILLVVLALAAALGVSIILQHVLSAQEI